MSRQGANLPPLYTEVLAHTFRAHLNRHLYLHGSSSLASDVRDLTLASPFVEDYRPNPIGAELLGEQLRRGVTWICHHAGCLFSVDRIHWSMAPVKSALDFATRRMNSASIV